jgi:predicted XRE-type DNA-binding protein
LTVIEKENLIKNKNMTKKEVKFKKIGTGQMPINVTALERMRQPGYRYINKGLSLNANPLEKSKYDICQDILSYTQENNISDPDLKKRLGIKQIELDYLVYCHVDKFTLDQLVNYASKLFTHFRLGIIPEKSLLFSQKSANGRTRKNA